MNNFQILKQLKDYPVTVCSADQVRFTKGEFVISNTQTNDQPGEHWVTFYFPRDEPCEFVDSLVRLPEHYRVGFEKLLDKPYYTSMDQIQDSKSDVCGLYCIYYVICRYGGTSMKDLLSIFDVSHKKKNDVLVTEKIIQN